MHKSFASGRATRRLKKLAAEVLFLSASATALYLLPISTAMLDSEHSLLSSALAASEERRPPPSTRQSETLTTPVFNRITEVMELRDMEKYDEARLVLDELKELYNRDRLNNREKYTMWLFYASLDQAQENYRGAIENYRQVLTIPDLPPDQLEQTWFYIGSLHYALEEFQQAIDAFNTYNEIALEPNEDVYLRIATAYYQLERYQDALPALLRNMELERAKGDTVPESTYGLLRALYLTLEDYPNARQTLREMIALFNQPGDWPMLAAIEAQLENFDVQAHTLYVANAGGYLDSENELIQLASQLFNNDNPIGCAEIMTKGISDGLIEEDEDNLAFLAQCYQIAREDALAAPYLERAAAMAEDGELYARLGRVYMTLSEFEKAADAFDMAHEKGELDRPDQVYLSQARTYLELNRHDEALAAARNAERDERSAATARSYVTFINTEKARYELSRQRRRELAEYFR